MKSEARYKSRSGVRLITLLAAFTVSAAFLIQTNSGCIDDPEALIRAILAEEQVREQFEGPEGPQGAKGDQGEKGEPGNPGDPGDVGGSGERGSPGAPGSDGADGADGQDGDKGDPGISCWDLNENGIRDPEEDLNGDDVVNVNDCSVGPPGPMGPMGPMPDHNWVTTQLRFENPDGSWGELVDLRGVQGPQGEPGQDGADGRDGADGETPWSDSSNGIYYNSGNVGIGTSSPHWKLHVSGGKTQLDNLDCGNIDCGTIDATGTINTTQHIYADLDINVGDDLEVDNDARIGGQLGVGTSPVSMASLKVYASSSIWGIQVTGSASTTSAYFGGSTITEGRIGGNNGMTLWVPDTGPGTPLVVDGSNIVRRNTSSLRYKHEIFDLPTSDGELMSLRPVSFRWNSTGERDIGLIAEEVAEVLPDLVVVNECGQPEAVKYDRLGVYLLQVVKVQRSQIAAQEQRLDRLERELAELKEGTRVLRHSG